MSERRAYVTRPDLRMDAYYFGFSATGERVIDEILSAVACAGKAYHHTDNWNDSDDGEPSYAELIQEAADRAAAVLRARGSPQPPSVSSEIETRTRPSPITAYWETDR